MQDIVELRNVTKEYQLGNQRVQALRGASLKVKAGQFLAIAGQSGSGKSTLLNLVGAMDRPTSGELLIEGNDIARLDRRGQDEFRLRKVGFVFQSFNLLHVFTAYQNVEMPLLLAGGMTAGERDKAVRQILEDVGLGEKVNRKPSELSGGEQQRVAIARAVVKRPPLVLADEPTANLDSRTSGVVIELIRSLPKKYNTTIIFSTHHEPLMEIADVAVRMKDGVFVA